MIDSELVAQIAKAIQVKTGGNVEGKIPEWWAELIGMALAELQSTGRLIPAGGMALTAEQVEDVRTVAMEVGGYTGEQFRQWHGATDRLVNSLFPATEPAECEFRCEEAIARARVGVRCPACTAVIRDKEAIDPSEEETKAEGPCEVRSPQGDTCSFPKSGHAGVHTWAWPDKQAPSSPVIPAPTETGPWQSLLAVPKSVVAVKDQNGDEWNRGTNGEFCFRVGCGNGHPDFAPFVAAEQG